MKIKQGAKPHESPDGFYYDLFEGGYIKPGRYLEGDDLKKVQYAIETITEFHDLMEDEDLLPEM